MKPPGGSQGSENYDKQILRKAQSNSVKAEVNDAGVSDVKSTFVNQGAGYRKALIATGHIATIVAMPKRPKKY